MLLTPALDGFLRCRELIRDLFICAPRGNEPQHAFITSTALSIAAAGSGKPPVVLARERLVDTALGAMVPLMVLWISCDREELAVEIR